MDFGKFTTDAKLAIVKLETYGLSCLTPCITRDQTFVCTNTDIRVWHEPTNWNERGALAEIIGLPNRKWSFQLNLIHSNNQIIIKEDVLVGFIMLPKRYQNPSVPDSKINADVFVDRVRVSTFQFEPFKFVPMFQNTFFLSIASYYHLPFIRFNQPVNYDVYCLNACLQTEERRYCAQHPQLLIRISEQSAIMYKAGMCGIDVYVGLNPDSLIFGTDLTTDLPILPRPNLPFDINEFLQVTYNPDRVVDWCCNTEQKEKWCVENK